MARHRVGGQVAESDSAPVEPALLYSRPMRHLPFLICLAMTAPASAAIKCWTNRDGVKECGDVVPAEYAQQGHEVKSEQGLTVSRQPPARTPEQIAQERKARKAAEAAAAKADATAERRRVADRMLLDTFGSEDDLLLARDGQIQNVESQIKLAESLIAKQEKSLADMISRAAQFERRKQPLPEDLSRNVQSAQDQIAEQRRFIAEKRAEQEALRAKFRKDLVRFRELRGQEELEINDAR